MKLANGKIRRCYSCAVEVKSLLDECRYLLVVNRVSANPGLASCLMWALARVRQIGVANIDWVALYKLPIDDFGLHFALPTAADRYRCVIDAYPRVWALFDQTASAIRAVAVGQFPGVSRVYSNLLLRLVLRAALADEKGLPVEK